MSRDCRFASGFVLCSSIFSLCSIWALRVELHLLVCLTITLKTFVRKNMCDCKSKSTVSCRLIVRMFNDFVDRTNQWPLQLKRASVCAKSPIEKDCLGSVILSIYIETLRIFVVINKIITSKQNVQKSHFKNSDIISLSHLGAFWFVFVTFEMISLYVGTFGSVLSKWIHKHTSINRNNINKASGDRSALINLVRRICAPLYANYEFWHLIIASQMSE